VLIRYTIQVNTAIEQLLEIEDKLRGGVTTKESLAVGMARLGQSTQQIVFGTLQQLLGVDFGEPLHCLALCGELHPLELQVFYCCI
jgi:diphthine synthase